MSHFLQHHFVKFDLQQTRFRQKTPFQDVNFQVLLPFVKYFIYQRNGWMKWIVHGGRAGSKSSPNGCLLF